MTEREVIMLTALAGSYKPPAGIQLLTIPAPVQAPPTAEDEARNRDDYTNGDMPTMEEAEV